MNREKFLTDVWKPYPAAKPGWVNVSEISDEQKSFFCCGRIQSIASAALVLAWAGKTASFQISKNLEWIGDQKQSHKPALDLFKVGDLVCVGVTQGEITQISLLAPNLDLTRQDTNVLTANWSKFINEVRGFFLSSGFKEALTPTLVPSPGTEPFLEAFSTEFWYGSHRRKFFLPTSPEFHLKKLLASGEARVFEFKTCFRNGEISEHHQPEFQMLEWYRAFATLDSIADDCEALIDRLAKSFRVNAPKLKRTTIAQLFKETVDFDLTPQTSREELAQLAGNLAIDVAHDDDFDDIFFRIFLNRIERDLGKAGPLLVRGYPPSQAALSRLGPDGFADRFEIYWNGVELANAFHELNDPIENANRFKKDAAKSRELGREPVPHDEELLRALKSGMPPSGGIALGLDRLFMVLCGIETIEQARPFPVRVSSET